MSAVDRRFKADPHAYLQAIARRAKRIEGVYSVGKLNVAHDKAWFTVVYSAASWTPPDEVRHAIDELRREFSAAFPSWGINVLYSRHIGVRVRRVVRTWIAEGRVKQELDCGHEVDAGRVRTKRQCECCSREVRQEREA